MSVLPSPRRAPGPTGYPVIGVFPMARRDPLGFFMDCARRYGDVVAMRLGPHRVYLLRHPDHVKHVLQGNARVYAKGPTATRVRALFGDSLTKVDGVRWRRRRHVLTAAVVPHGVAAARVSLPHPRRTLPVTVPLWHRRSHAHHDHPDVASRGQYSRPGARRAGLATTVGIHE